MNAFYLIQTNIKSNKQPSILSLNLKTFENNVSHHRFRRLFSDRSSQTPRKFRRHNRDFKRFC